MCKNGKHTFDKRFSKRYKKNLQPCDCFRKQLDEISAMVDKWPKWMRSVDMGEK